MKAHLRTYRPTPLALLITCVMAWGRVAEAQIGTVPPPLSKRATMDHCPPQSDERVQLGSIQA